MAKSVEINVHDFDYRLYQTLNLIKRDFSKANARIIKKYDIEMINQTLAKATRWKHLQTLVNLTKMIKKDWEEVTKEDIDELVSEIMERFGSSNGQESNYSYDHKKILKIFFRWFKLGNREHREVGDPPETKSVRLRPVRDTLIREDLITEDDFRKLLKACGSNQRDRAFLYAHYEAGTRPSEILNLKIKHVKFDKVGANIHVFGKTGARTIRLIKSVPDLARWINVHPNRDNSESPLWVMIEHGRENEALTYEGARAILRRRCREAKITKCVNLKIFRHSEATTTAQFLTEAQLRKRHGWSPTSKMPARYVHMINADVDQAILEHYGITTQEKKSLNLPKICQICEYPNSHDSEICGKCGRPLNIKAAVKQDELIESQKDEMERLLHRIEALESRS